MKYLQFFFILVSISTSVYSQDKIVKTDGSKINCKIENEDSIRVYFSYFIDGKKTNTFINKQDVLSIDRKLKPPAKNYAPEGMSVGLGTGLNYGLIGGNILFYPQKNIGIFMSGGYQLTKLAFDVGIKLRSIGKSNTSILKPTATIMYGANTYIWLRYQSSYNTYFKGITLGLGLDAHFNGNKRGYWSFDVLYPFRDDETIEYINEMKDEGMGFRFELLPIVISAGYRFIFD
jgi:hypothetical protein